MALPGLRQALQDAGVAALKRTFVWPRRIMARAPCAHDSAAHHLPHPWRLRSPPL